jgi:hypothetical protein
MGQRFEGLDSAMAGASFGRDITPSATAFTQHTRFIMVDTDDVTVTGEFIGEATSHTTVPLKKGLIYPFFFSKITAVSGGTVKGYF